jgi:hypothetical protein
MVFVERLLSEQPVENLLLEFKREAPKKDETLKKLSAFANTLGGLMVIGAEAPSKDGRLVGLPGIDPQANYSQTIVQWCSEGVSPPLEVNVSDSIPTPSNVSKVCYVVRVRESDIAPHFLNGRKGVYIRTGEFSSRFDAQLANENELRQLFQRREVVLRRRAELLQRARNRFRTFTEQKYKALGQNKNGQIGARCDLCIVPRFPAQPVCNHARLLPVVTSTTIPWRQVGFPRTTGGGNG